MQSKTPDRNPLQQESSVADRCREVAEALPWLANGSLTAAERPAVERHLETCDRCRAELRQTLEAARLFSQHIPVADLIDHAMGLEPSSISDDEIELHLSHCESCREQHAIVAAELRPEETAFATVTDIAEARASREASTETVQDEALQPSRRRRLEWIAAAACLTLAVIWTSSDSPLVPGQSDDGSLDPVTVGSSDPNEIFSLELTAAGAVPLMADGRAVLDGIFLDGFESPEALNWSDVSVGSERQATDPEHRIDVAKPLTTTSEET